MKKNENIQSPNGNNGSFSSTGKFPEQIKNINKDLNEKKNNEQVHYKKITPLPIKNKRSGSTKQIRNKSNKHYKDYSDLKQFDKKGSFSFKKLSHTRKKSSDDNKINKLSNSMNLSNIIKKIKNENKKKFISTLSYKFNENNLKDGKEDMNSLQKMIDLVNKFDKEIVKKELKEKETIKNELNENLDKITEYIKTIKIQKKKDDYNKFKLEKRINLLNFVKQKYKFCNKEVSKIVNEIEELTNKKNDLNNDTIKKREKSFIEYSNVIKLKNSICEMNKKISEIERDREAIIPGINLLNKHNNEIKSKLVTQQHFNSNFMLNMTEMIEKFYRK
jgi:hypothetical protein